MELSWIESQKILRKGRAALLFSTCLPVTEGMNEAVQAYYSRAANSLEAYAVNTLLFRIEERISRSPRRYRLHAAMPRLALMGEGEMIADRWISLTLTLLSEEDGAVLRRQDYRVWDGKKGCLCPLEFFLPRKEARKYCRWSFSLRGDTVWGIPAKKGGNHSIPTLEIAGKMKILPLAIDSKG